MNVSSNNDNDTSRPTKRLKQSFFHITNTNDDGTETTLDQARIRITEILKGHRLWNYNCSGVSMSSDYPHYCHHDPLANDAGQFACDTFMVLDLLNQFPALATESFWCGSEYSGMNCPPLAPFIWNNFNVKILNRLLEMHPKALGQEECDSLLRCHTKRELDLPVKVWTAEHLDKSCDTAQVLVEYMATVADEEEEDDGLSIETIIVALVTKSPDFSKVDMSHTHLLDTLVLFDVSGDTIKRTLSKLPVENRALHLNRMRLADLFGCERFDDLSDYNVGFLKELLPELTHLRVDLYCVSDDVEGFLQELARCQTLRTLCVEIPTDWAYVTKQEWLSDFKSLLSQQWPSTQLSLELNEGWDDLDGMVEMFGDEDIDQDDNLTMEMANNACVDSILTVLRGRSAVVGVSGTALLKEITVKDLNGVHYESMADLCQYTHSLRLENVGLVSRGCVAGHVCCLWKQNCSKFGASVCMDAFRVVSALSKRINSIPRTAVFTNGPHGPSLVELTIQQGSTTAPLVNITRALVAALKLRTLERLQVRCKVAHTLEISTFCQALKTETPRLEKLELDGVDFCIQDDRKVEDWILETVEHSVTKTLSVLLIGDQDSYHFVSNCNRSTPLFSSKYRRNYGPTNRKIQYLLNLNAAGRQKLRAKETTKNDFVGLLSNIESIHMPATGDRTSICYDLLREAPALWSV